MVGDIFGRRLYSTSGGVDYDYDNNAIVFATGGSISDANDRVGGNFELNHDLKVGTNITFKPIVKKVPKKERLANLLDCSFALIIDKGILL